MNPIEPYQPFQREPIQFHSSSITSSTQKEAKEIKIVSKEFIFDNAPFPTCHASTIIEIEPGIFMAAWFGGTREKAPDVGIWTSIYRNETWSIPKETVKHDGMPFWNPVLFKMPSGEILLFYKHGPNPREWLGFLARSLDSGETWNQEEHIVLSNGEKGLGPIKNKPLLLEDGTLICGTSVEDQQPNICYTEYSKDGGKTWERSGSIGPLYLNDKTYGIIQPTLLQTNNGLIMLGRPRDNLGHVWYSKSLDQGLSWSLVEKLDFPSPDSGLDAITLKDGRHLLVYNHTKSGRKRLDVAISNDGKNWTHILNLEEYIPSPCDVMHVQEKKEPIEFSYPAVIQSKDGRVHITYTWNRKRVSHVILEEI
ncbi:sialidase family protein [Parachlamydia sp. AcF125]|uniref:sialidase family protein n=1 Tax=Parachlamydia sp. AcF125 TaxID=2795736 RepID=UPI001BC9C189|nr:sialidase family protein [Parachlamydia sp. AcF125]MBS4168976.1 hypothetical protein [Parachlamydia sp. AcF125]